MDNVHLQKKYLVSSLILHGAIVLLLILGFDFTAPMPVFENTNQHDVISAVVLGDTAKSKILPQEIPSKPPVPPEIKPAPPQITKAKPMVEPVKKDVIALTVEKKKIAEKKALEERMQRELADNLMADIKKQAEKQKKIRQKALKAQFENTLREQAEKSLRQQLLSEEVKLKGTEARQSQGEVNKYKALIVQAISEHWLVPPQANKKLVCELTIRVAPGGMVLDVQVSKSSGDPSLDSSARAAVMKSSPLPVPRNSNDFEPFRQFVLKVKPENVINNDIV
jgi:colicin import membrane protein